ncbi:MAG TPA: Maf family protein [Rheinheimera sp.]|nr:Maf family protein [Rheinheimera sp.]
MSQQPVTALYLASTSRYRQQLLAKLTDKFCCIKPDVDETPLPGEAAQELVERLALAKARSVASTLASGLVIGSDQVAVFNNVIIGKPHTVDKACEQLRLFSGQKVTFLTGLAVINAASGQQQLVVEPFTVHFRNLSDAEIAAYIHKEQPLDCAGSFKSEGLGISLFSRLEGDDPNSLIGLPLIRLNQMLINEGINLLLY